MFLHETKTFFWAQTRDPYIKLGDMKLIFSPDFYCSEHILFKYQLIRTTLRNDLNNSIPSLDLVKEIPGTN